MLEIDTELEATPEPKENKTEEQRTSCFSCKGRLKDAVSENEFVLSAFGRWKGAGTCNSNHSGLTSLHQKKVCIASCTSGADE